MLRVRNTALSGFVGAIAVGILTLLIAALAFGLEGWIQPWSGFVVLSVYVLFLLPLAALLLYGAFHFGWGCGISAGWFVLSLIAVVVSYLVAVYASFWLGFAILTIYAFVVGTIVVAVLSMRIAMQVTPVVVVTPVP